MNTKKNRNSLQYWETLKDKEINQPEKEIIGLLLRMNSKNNLLQECHPQLNCNLPGNCNSKMISCQDGHNRQLETRSNKVHSKNKHQRLNKLNSQIPTMLKISSSPHYLRRILNYKNKFQKNKSKSMNQISLKVVQLHPNFMKEMKKINKTRMRIHRTRTKKKYLSSNNYRRES